jgi:hypothetical protein
MLAPELNFLEKPFTWLEKTELKRKRAEDLLKDEISR